MVNVAIPDAHEIVLPPLAVDEDVLVITRLGDAEFLHASGIRVCSDLAGLAGVFCGAALRGINIARIK